MDFQAFWAEMWARCGPAHMGFEQCEAARDVYEKAKAQIEAAERERCSAKCEALGWDGPPSTCETLHEAWSAATGACSAAVLRT